MSRRVPHDLDAETALLGAMLKSREAIEAAATADVTFGDFYKPIHAAIFAAIVNLYGEGKPADPVTVSGALAGTPPVKALLALEMNCPASANASAYAATVTRSAHHRRAITHANAVSEAAYTTNDELLTRLLTEPPRLDAPIEKSAATVELDDLLAMPDPVPKPIVIPGLIRSGEVLVLTGFSGGGKMTLLRQMAVGVAAGVHPFTDLPMVRGKVLVVDLQEDLTEIAAEVKKLRAHVGPHYRGEGFEVVSRRQGLDLYQAHDARWFESLIVTHEPTLVIMGPLKKMYRPPDGKSTWDDTVVEAVHRRFDDWQQRYGFALMLEGHAGHDRDTWRVKGSSAWYDWPHFGYGLSPVAWHPREVEMIRWRGDRENGVPRHWPRKLTAVAGGFPWQADTNSVDAMRLVQQRGTEIDQPTLEEESF